MSVRKGGFSLQPPGTLSDQFGRGRGWGPAGFPEAPRRGPSLRKRAALPCVAASPGPTGRRSCSSRDARLRTQAGEGSRGQELVVLPKEMASPAYRAGARDFCPRVPDTSAFHVLAPNKCTEGHKVLVLALFTAPSPILPYSEGKAKRGGTRVSPSRERRLGSLQNRGSAPSHTPH